MRRRHDAPAGDPVTIDEDSGRVGGTALGDDLRAVRRALGPGKLDAGPRTEDEPPVPRLIDAPPGPARGGEIAVVVYPGMEVMVASETGAYAFLVWREGTRTARGLRLGDSQASARRRYPGLECAQMEPVHGRVGYRYCTIKVGRHYLWLGDDPISSIAIGYSPMY